MTVLLIQWLVAGCLVAAVATIAIHLVPAGAAAERHRLWWAALMAVLLMPAMLSIVDTATSARAVTEALPAAGQLTAPVTIPVLPSWVMTAVVVLWMLMTAVAGARLVVAYIAMRRVARRAAPLDIIDVSVARGARILVSSETSGACAVGYLRPSIILSAELVSSLDETMLRSIVLHESAHLARRDDWTRLAQRIVLAIGGLHPAVRWISRQIDIEREAACDQYVVAGTVEAVAYARSLTVAAEIAWQGRSSHSALAPGVSISGRGLHARVSRLLQVSPVPPVKRAAVSLAGFAVVVIAAAGSLAIPPLVAVEAVVDPIATIASVPLADGLTAALPGAHGLPERPATAVSGLRSGEPVQSRQNVAASAESKDRVDGDVVPEVAVQHEPSAAQPPLEALAAPVRTFQIPPIGADDPRHDRASIGETAARKGTAAGTAASRAGQSIGRFFTRGGQAIAGSF